uniref:Granulin a n=1 Tax=Sparus aurata TaxID=8175 RepID=A0A671X506_SPAAU
MIKSNHGEDDDNVCPDQSRCPAEFSCLKALTRFGCCPLAQGVACSDGKHCCPEGHECSADCRSCTKKELVTTVQCDDKGSECPDGTTCCINPDGKWGCCPMPKAVCCEDKLHCCPEGTTCDLEHSKCTSLSTKKEMPMWAKLPARIRADWENQKGQIIFLFHCNVTCDDTSSCPDETTCCKTTEGGWACCPLPEAVCCEDLIHCCPHGKKCNLAAMTCDDETCSVPLVKKIPTIPRQGAQAGNVPCDTTSSCPDETTCCKNKTGGWACCPLPEAVCCDDHEHCCPAGSTCDVTSLSCDSSSGSTPMQKKIPAFVTEAPTTGRVACDDHTSCPHSSTCCFMKSSQKWGCCPLPEAVCCDDGNHCCPAEYKCSESKTCVKGEVVIPWYPKLPASSSLQADPTSVQCDGSTQCPDHTTCCQLATGEWGCCPMENAVCCPDKEHCCPRGYTCNFASNSCQKLVTLQLDSVPMTPVYLLEHRPQLRDVKCDDTTSCPDGETCCRMSATTWGCCPYPNV